MRRSSFRFAALACLALAVPLLTAAQPDFSEAQLTTVAVADGLHMLVGPGGNIGVASGADGVFLVDDQYAPMTDKVKAAVAAISDKPIRFVLNTHWHGDHTGGNENFGKGGALIVAHDNVRERMSTEQFLEVFDNRVPPSPEAALPVVTFTDAVTFHLNGEEIHAFHVDPAHTDGDSIVHFVKSNVVHMGDIYFNGTYPFIDASTGGRIDGVIAAVDRVLAMIDDSTKIMPGHGSVSNKAELMAYRDMLHGVMNAIVPLIEAGKSAEEVVAAKPTAPWDEEWSAQFRFAQPDIFTKIVYDGLKKR